MSDLVSGDKVIIILIPVITIIITIIKVILIMDAFNSLADRGGVVRTKELGNLMKRLGENPTKEEVQVTLANLKSGK